MSDRWWIAERKYHSLARRARDLDTFPLPADPGLDVPGDRPLSSRRDRRGPLPNRASSSPAGRHGTIVSMPLLVVRHAHAGRRSAYRGDDRVRPLSPRGKARARELVPLLSRLPAAADPVQPVRALLRHRAAAGRGPRAAGGVGRRAGRGAREPTPSGCWPPWPASRPSSAPTATWPPRCSRSWSRTRSRPIGRPSASRRARSGWSSRPDRPWPSCEHLRRLPVPAQRPPESG